MANEYYPDCFDPSNVVQEDMVKIETNFEALRSVFSSPSGPASPVAFQQWADNSASVNMIKVRDATNTQWFDLFDAENNEIQISDTVRKGSIVQGEDIDPATCTLNCGGGSLAYISNFPCDYIGSSVYERPGITGQQFDDIPGMSVLSYVYDTIEIRGKVFVDSTGAGSNPFDIKVRFMVGTEVSSESVQFTASGVWSPEVSLTVAAGGWKTVKWQVNTLAEIGTTVFVTVRGHNLNQVVA